MKLSRPAYFIVFIVEVVALSWVFGAWRDFWVAGGNWALGKLLLSIAWFSFLFFILGFFMYEEEKKKGKVTRPMKWYEWLEAKGFHYG